MGSVNAAPIQPPPPGRGQVEALVQALVAAVADVDALGVMEEVFGEGGIA